MKKKIQKILCVFLSLLFVCNTALAEEIARLYLIENITSVQAKTFIKPELNIHGYNIIEQNGFYIVENPSQNIYNVIGLKKNGSDCYYYFLSNDSLKLNKKILETFDTQNYNNKRIRNSGLLTLFRSEAGDVLSKSPTALKTVTTAHKEAAENNYDFSDEAQHRFDTQTAAKTPQIPLTVPQNPVIQPQKTTTLMGSVVQIQAGQQFNVVLSSTISSDSIENNDNISARLDEDWVVNGIKIAPAGSIITGRVVNSRSAGYAMGDGRIGIDFTQIFTHDGKIIPLSTNEVRVLSDNNRALKVGGKVLAGALSGLVLGAVLMLCGADAKSLAGSAAVGGAFGAISAAATKGEEVYVPEGSVMQIILQEPMTAQPYMEY